MQQILTFRTIQRSFKWRKSIRDIIFIYRISDIVKFTYIWFTYIPQALGLFELIRDLILNVFTYLLTYFPCSG